MSILLDVTAWNSITNSNPKKQNLSKGRQVEEREELAADLLGSGALVFLTHTEDIVALHKRLRQKLPEFAEPCQVYTYIYANVYVSIYREAWAVTDNADVQRRFGVQLLQH